MTKETIITLTEDEIKAMLFEYCKEQLNTVFENLEIDTVILGPEEDEWEKSSTIQKIVLKLT